MSHTSPLDFFQSSNVALLYVSGQLPVDQKWDMLTPFIPKATILSAVQEEKMLWMLLPFFFN